MPTRFYSRPIDPGYAQFGAAIAAGMGQGMRNYDFQQQRRLEEAERERQRQLEESERAAQQAMRGQFLVGEEPAPAAIPVTQVGGMPVIRNVSPIAGATGAAPVVVPAVQRAPAATVEEALTGEGVVRPAVQQTVSRAAPPAAPPAAPAEAEDLITWTDPVSGQQMAIDPSRSLDARNRAARFREEQAQKDQVRGEVRSVIAQVLEDGVIDRQTEWPLLVSWGLKPQDLEDPEKAAEKAAEKEWQQRKQELDYRHDLEMQEIRLRNEGRGGTGAGAGGIRGALTPNQALDNAEAEIAGLARMLISQGMNAEGQQQVTAPWLMEVLGPRAAEVGGIGNLANIIEDVMVNAPRATDIARARSAAASNLSARGILPINTENYDALLSEEMNNILGETQEAISGERRGLWRAPRPGTQSAAQAPRTGGAIAQATAPDEAPAPAETGIDIATIDPETITPQNLAQVEEALGDLTPAEIARARQLRQRGLSAVHAARQLVRERQRQR